MKKQLLRDRTIRGILIAALFILSASLLFLIWGQIPNASIRYTSAALIGGMILVLTGWAVYLRRQIHGFADELCSTIDALMADRKPEHYQPYEDTLAAKIDEKLLRYYDMMRDSKEQCLQDRQKLQEIVSDISHQVKTPIANMKIFTGILQQHTLPPEKQAEFLHTLEGQVSKLDFLMQSLIKMSRLETGTFIIHTEDSSLYNTIAQAISGVWTKAEQKEIQLEVNCDSHICVKHDSKWTAEALTNILDNAVKYTPPKGSVTVNVRPWHFYTRIDITDTGIGIPEKHYQDVFHRFFRAEEVAAEEGLGLGLYLAQGIITRQKGYISVKSTLGNGTTFSVFLLS